MVYSMRLYFTVIVEFPQHFAADCHMQQVARLLQFWLNVLTMQIFQSLPSNMQHRFSLFFYNKN